MRALAGFLALVLAFPATALAAGWGPDGHPRINLNQGMLTELYDQLQKEFNEDAAKFVVAYRMNGPKNQPSSSKSGSSVASNSKNTKSSGSTKRGATAGPIIVPMPNDDDRAESAATRRFLQARCYTP